MCSAGRVGCGDGSHSHCQCAVSKGGGRARPQLLQGINNARWEMGGACLRLPALLWHSEEYTLQGTEISLGGCVFVFRCPVKMRHTPAGLEAGGGTRNSVDQRNFPPLPGVKFGSGLNSTCSNHQNCLSFNGSGYLAARSCSLRSSLLSPSVFPPLLSPPVSGGPNHSLSASLEVRQPS